MKKWTDIKRWWKNRTNKFPKTENRVIYAFTVGGRDYYQMDDVFNLPYKRGISAISVYEEANMKCTREYLKAHAEACEKLMSGNKFGMKEALELQKLNMQLKQRLNWIVDTEIVYKLAAVVFFDENESPEKLDWNYCRQKIEFWKQHEGVADFFLHQPVQKLIPFLQESDVNVEAYSQVTSEITKTHWDNIFKMLSGGQKKKWKSSSSRLFSTETSPN